MTTVAEALERAAYLVEHLAQQVPEFTGVVGPAGEKEDDDIRDGLLEEAGQWRELARTSGDVEFLLAGLEVDSVSELRRLVEEHRALVARYPAMLATMRALAVVTARLHPGAAAID